MQSTATEDKIFKESSLYLQTGCCMVTLLERYIQSVKDTKEELDRLVSNPEISDQQKCSIQRALQDKRLLRTTP